MNTFLQLSFTAKSTLALLALTLTGCPLNVNLITDKPITLVIDKPIKVDGNIAVTKLPPITLGNPLRKNKK
ncbi:hypothetical protein [Methylobacter svalbardensis]|uniref:hypothetical protein n=1 Tax=Methylobacter svalbardensis TaxID=3080016 RepID=UPI0030ED07AA